MNPTDDSLCDEPSLILLKATDRKGKWLLESAKREGIFVLGYLREHNKGATYKDGNRK